MRCKISCIIALIFLIIKLYLMFSPSIYNEFAEFDNTLTDSLKERYQKIIEERRNISLKGYGFGLILSAIYLYFNKNSKIMTKVCIVGSITFVTNYLFYIIYPKSDYMILHLDKDTQRKEWLDIYRKMQLKYHSGFLLGIIIAMLICYGVF